MLTNARHERFAQLVAAGTSASEAYRKAGYTSKNVNVHGPRLMANGGIKERVREILAKVEKKTLLTIEERRQFLADVVRAEVSKIPLNSHLIQSIKTGKDGTEIRLPDKVKSLELDAKMAGELVEKQETSHVLPGSLEEAIASLIHGKAP